MRLILGSLLLLFSCSETKHLLDTPACFVTILGIAQDGGYPHAGCQRQCCNLVYQGRRKPKQPVCLGLIDRGTKQIFMLEATPGFSEQWRQLQTGSGYADKKAPDGIFLTHAHIGHYAGLMQLGREVMGAKNVPVWAMPRMAEFLRQNGPWSQLVSLKNIEIKPLQRDSAVQITPQLRITPFQVPHRDEFSETVGYTIESPSKKLLFIPDIDKWEKWQSNVVEEVRKVDYALVDATFYQDGELPGRSIKEVPHPFVEETMRLFEHLPAAERAKIIFIHFNHTNPLLWDEPTRKKVEQAGFKLAEEGMQLAL
ncbi:MAG: MBL fold metallo-hydrolase [Saprospiraceae bacterium]|nr:MBL fold metallo-hydrolase [Saprospiraceae bacterium]